LTRHNDTPAPPRPEVSTRPILRRLLPALVALLILLGIGVTSLLWRQHQANMDQRTATANAELTLDFQAALAFQAAGMATALQPIGADPRVLAALATGSNDRLLADWLPVFENMKRGHAISHFYFLDAGRRCLLRVHKPEKHGDLIDRHTARAAEQTRRAAWGIELGPLGTFTLRVVQPVFQAGVLIGYVELGKEIEDVLAQLHNRAGRQVAVTIGKQHLNRGNWEAGMRLLGREPDWERLPDSVVVYASQGYLPDVFTAQIERGHDQPDREAEFDGKTWRVSATPLRDAAGKGVGDLLVMNDITAERQAFAHTLLVGGIAGGGLLALLLGFVVTLLRHTDRGIQAQQEALLINEKRLSYALQGANDGLWDWNLETNEVYYSPRWLDMLGYAPGELPETLDTWSTLVHPDDKGPTLAAVTAYLNGDADQYQVEFRMRHKDGHWLHILARAQLARAPDGQPLVPRRLVGTHVDLSERKAIALALAEREAQLRTLIEAVPDSIQFKDGEGRWLIANSVCLRLFGLEGADWHGLTNREIGQRQPRLGAAMATCQASDDQAWQAGGPSRSEESVLDTENREVLFDVVKAPLFDERGQRHAQVVVGRDISQRKRTEDNLRLAASVFSHAREGIMITAPSGDILEVNEAFTVITGYDRAEVIGKNPRLLGSGRQSKGFYAAMWGELKQNGHWQGEVWNRRKTGEVYAAMQTISTVRDDRGEVLRYVALFSDITPLKEHQRQLERIAHYDALTGLPNRVLLADRLHQAMTQVQRRGTMLAVAYLDLDGFKAINDAHGHDAGDRLLTAVATRMKQALREGDTIARLGGDEFVAVLLDLPDHQACVPMLDRLLAASAVPVWTDGLELRVSGSLGVAFFPQAEPIDADQLLRQADQAMYQAKLAGKNRYHIFDADQDRNVRGHHESLEHIRRAMAEREFELYYQPKVNMRSGTVIGAEALIRWRHPDRGVLPPAVFLPVIEDHPLAITLGDWVLDTALTQIEAWKAAGLNLPVSVNIDAMQLQPPDFVDRLKALLAAHPGVGPGDLELEVLETSALEDIAHVSDVILACRELGIAFALDDFGTGYSSLTYLKRLPAGQLKIDQSFVRDMLDDPEDLAILEGVLGLANAFRREALAEGVETLPHGEMLLRLGCDLGQGYAIARPMPAAAIPAWLAAWRPAPSWLGRQPSSRDDLPVLFGLVEHRAWVAAVTAYLMGERDAPPVMDHHQCRFGSWLDHDGRERHGKRSVFAAIDLLHREIHDRAGELLALKRSGRGAEAQARIGEIHSLRDTLLERLLSLLS
jgi:diguanylate cyclase (GGDEF)-like protein/PAS domain S-box-containing protein